FKLMSVHRRLDGLPPELDRNFIRHELTLARVFQEGFADFCARIYRAENIAAGAMIKTGNRAERFPLCSLAAARGAEQNERVVSHQRNTLYRKLARTGKANRPAIFQPRPDRHSPVARPDRSAHFHPPTQKLCNRGRAPQFFRAKISSRAGG